MHRQQDKEKQVMGMEEADKTLQIRFVNVYLRKSLKRFEQRIEVIQYLEEFESMIYKRKETINFKQNKSCLGKPQSRMTFLLLTRTTWGLTGRSVSGKASALGIFSSEEPGVDAVSSNEHVTWAKKMKLCHW